MDQQIGLDRPRGRFTNSGRYRHRAAEGLVTLEAFPFPNIATISVMDALTMGPNVFQRFGEHVGKLLVCKYRKKPWQDPISPESEARLNEIFIQVLAIRESGILNERILLWNLLKQFTDRKILAKALVEYAPARR